MFDKRLYFYLIDKPLNQLRTHFLQRYLLNRSHKFTCVMLNHINTTKSTLTQHLPQSELLKETRLPLTQYLVSFRLLNTMIMISIRRSQNVDLRLLSYLQCRFATIKCRNLHIFMILVFGLTLGLHISVQ